MSTPSLPALPKFPPFPPSNRDKVCVTITDIDIFDHTFDWAYLKNGVVENVDFKGSTFSQSNLENCRFTNCNLTDVRFNDCNLARTKFDGCIITGASFKNCSLDGTDFSTCVLESIRSGFKKAVESFTATQLEVLRSRLLCGTLEGSYGFWKVAFMDYGTAGAALLGNIANMKKPVPSYLSFLDGVNIFTNWTNNAISKLFLEWTEELLTQLLPPGTYTFENHAWKKKQ